MAVENENRVDLSFYEIARKYMVWLDEGLFESMAQIAEVVGLNRSTISRVVAISRIPQAVIDALADPRAIGPSWAVKVNRILDAAPDRVERVRGRHGLTPSGVLDLLEGGERPQREHTAEYEIGGTEKMVVRATRGGGTEIRLSRVLSDEQARQLASLIAGCDHHCP